MNVFCVSYIIKIIFFENEPLFRRLLDAHYYMEIQKISEFIENRLHSVLPLSALLRGLYGPTNVQL